MKDPNWLTRQEIDFLHDIALKRYGGLQGVRGELVESALGRVQNQHAYGENNIFKLASGYSDAILRNHPFSDGNKRTAFASAEAFLSKNGYQLEPEKNKNHQDMILDLEQGLISKEDSAKYLREHSRSLQQDQSQGKARSARDILKDQRDQSRAQKR